MRHQLHVPLLDNPLELRATEGEAAGEGRFELLGKPNAGERWMFEPGEIVECVRQTLPDGSKVLVVSHSCSADPEYRKRRWTYLVAGALFGGFLGGVPVPWLGWGGEASLIGAIAGAVVVGTLSVRWGDSVWRYLSDWFSSDRWPRGW